MKRIIMICILFIALINVNSYAQETYNVNLEVKSLSVYNDNIDLLNMDAIFGKKFFHISGLLHFTSGTISLLSGTGIDTGKGYLIQANTQLDFINIFLNYDGSGTVDYYSVSSDNKIILLGSGQITLTSLE